MREPPNGAEIDLNLQAAKGLRKSLAANMDSTMIGAARIGKMPLEVYPNGVARLARNEFVEDRQKHRERAR